jgi:hypothetical protein
MARWLRWLAFVACSALLGAGVATAASSAKGPVLPSKDPFYRYKGSLKGIAPGTVLKQRQVTIVDQGQSVPLVKGEQLLYRTTGELGNPLLAVTTVIEPLISAPTTKIVSYQTAYDALGTKCDPSYTLRGGRGGGSTARYEEQLLLGYVLTGGYTVVVPDYEGVNMRWIAGQQSGYATLDGIRAAEHYLKVPEQSTPVAMVGYSGGSIATDFGAELQSKYAKGLDIVGAAEGGVPVMLAHNLFYINGSPSWSGIIPSVVYSLERAFNIDINKFLSAFGKKLIGQEKGGCINSYTGRYPGLRYQKMLKPRYKQIFSIGAFVRIVNRLIMSRTGTPREPMLIGVGDGDGTGDGLMVAADDEALAHAYCKRGVKVRFTEFQGSPFTHTNAALPFEAAAYTWLTTLLNGGPASSDCATIGNGNSLKPIKRKQ